MDPEVTHRGVRQIQLQGLPLIAVIKRDPDGVLSAGKQQSLAGGVRPNRVHGGVIRQPMGDRPPSLAAVACAIDVRAPVIDAEATDGSIGRVLIEGGDGDLSYLAPGS